MRLGMHNKVRVKVVIPPADVSQRGALQAHPLKLDLGRLRQPIRVNDRVWAGGWVRS